jgi:hypothetical protein
MVHQGGTVEERILTAIRVGLHEGMEELCDDASGAIMDEQNLNTFIYPLFEATVHKPTEVDVKTYTFVRWVTSKGEKQVCDKCKALDGSKWVLEDTSEYSLKMIDATATNDQRIRFHENQVGRPGACQCHWEDISDEIQAWFISYMSRNEDIVEGSIKNSIDERLPEKSIPELIIGEPNKPQLRFGTM